MSENCSICSRNSPDITVECCNNEICNKCWYQWGKDKHSCPFCRRRWCNDCNGVTQEQCGNCPKVFCQDHQKGKPTEIIKTECCNINICKRCKKCTKRICPYCKVRWCQICTKKAIPGCFYCDSYCCDHLIGYNSFGSLITMNCCDINVCKKCYQAQKHIYCTLTMDHCQNCSKPFCVIKTCNNAGRNKCPVDRCRNIYCDTHHCECQQLIDQAKCRLCRHLLLILLYTIFIFLIATIIYIIPSWGDNYQAFAFVLLSSLLIISISFVCYILNFLQVWIDACRPPRQVVLEN